MVREERVRVVVDQREKNSLVASELMALGVEVEFQRLPVADYIIGKVAIERKTASDFVNSLINKRLLRQLEELKQSNKQLLIIEGNLKETEFNPGAIRGMLLSIMIDFGIPIIFTENYEETAEFLASLVKRLKRGKTENGLKFKKKVYNMAEQQQIVIEGFPSIGPSLAKALLKEFKTIRAIANASEEELCKVEKIGKKKAKIIKTVLEESYKPR